MPLVGASALRARIDNLRNSFKPAGRRWAEDTVRLAKARVPIGKTGRTRNSIRVKSATQRRAIVSVLYTGRFVEGDTKAHDIRAKGKALRFPQGGRTVFAKKVHRRQHSGRPFLAPSAAQALDRSPIRDELIAAWNEGAP